MKATAKIWCAILDISLYLNLKIMNITTEKPYFILQKSASSLTGSVRHEEACNKVWPVKYANIWKAVFAYLCKYSLINKQFARGFPSEGRFICFQNPSCIYISRENLRFPADYIPNSNVNFATPSQLFIYG